LSSMESGVICSDSLLFLSVCAGAICTARILLIVFAQDFSCPHFCIAVAASSAAFWLV
jgi:hypothetical protein